MSDLVSKLGRLSQGLSGRERALLVLKALHAGQEPDPQLRIIDDPVQRRIFDRSMGYINAANSELHSITHNLIYQTEWIEQSHIVELLLESAGLAQESTGESVDQRKVKNWRKAKSVNAPEFFYGVAEEMRLHLLDLVVTVCKEIKAVETVRRELAQEFEGEELTLPEVQAVTADLSTRLHVLLATLKGPKALPEPEDDRVDAIRERLEHVFRYWRLIEVRPEGTAPGGLR